MTKKLLVCTAILALALAATVVAITNGTPDGGNHPYVVLLVFGEETTDGFVPHWRCSGALIDAHLVLTAGHCTSGASGAGVWTSPGPALWGSWEPRIHAAGHESRGRFGRNPLR